MFEYVHQRSLVSNCLSSDWRFFWSSVACCLTFSSALTLFIPEVPTFNGLRQNIPVFWRQHKFNCLYDIFYAHGVQINRWPIKLQRLVADKRTSMTLWTGRHDTVMTPLPAGSFRQPTNRGARIPPKKKNDWVGRQCSEKRWIADLPPQHLALPVDSASNRRRACGRCRITAGVNFDVSGQGHSTLFTSLQLNTSDCVDCCHWTRLNGCS